MTVLGIAGPGDGLANPKKTFETFRMLQEQAPDIKLCLSTNGLALPDFVDEICKYNVDHVTITINMVDAVVGEKIYLKLVSSASSSLTCFNSCLNLPKL